MNVKESYWRTKIFLLIVLCYKLMLLKNNDGFFSLSLSFALFYLIKRIKMSLLELSPQKNIVETLDLRGLTCPVPLMRTKKVLKSLNNGDSMKIIIDDPATKNDLTRFCQKTHSRIVSQMAAEYESSDGDATGVKVCEVFIIEKTSSE